MCVCVRERERRKKRGYSDFWTFGAEVFSCLMMDVKNIGILTHEIVTRIYVTERSLKWMLDFVEEYCGDVKLH